MHFSKSAVLLAVLRVAAESTTAYPPMGPAAFMWPTDRPWSADTDNIAPCGSSSGVGPRTEFPMTNGRLAIIAQNHTRAMHVGISYSNNPTSQSDFDTFYGPQQVHPDIGHTCIWTPDAPANVSAGSNATFQVFYLGEDDSQEVYYACTDITYVDAVTFHENIPCFNATRSDPGTPSIDHAVNVTTTLPNGTDPHPDLDHNDGISGAEVAGVVIGPLLAAALLVGFVFFLWRRKKQSRVTSIRQAEKAGSDVTLH